MVDYSRDSHDRMREAFDNQKFKDALYFCRRHVTWYRLCHLAHTVPIQPSMTPVAKELMTVDINAMGSLLDDLFRCHFLSGKISEFQRVLGELRPAIDDPRWRIKVNYTLGIWFLNHRKDRNAAKRVADLQEARRTSDVDYITLCLDVLNGEIGLEDKIHLCNRIIKLSEKESYILKYSTLKGIFLFLSGDTKVGSQHIEGAINRYCSHPEKRDDYGDHELAEALVVLSEIRMDKDLAKRAVAEFGKIVDHLDDFESPHLKACILKSFGDAYFHSGDLLESIGCYQRSIEYSREDLTLVFLGRGLARTGDQNGARNTLRSVIIENLNPSGIFDLGVSWAILAFTSKSRTDSEEAKRNLQHSGPQDIFFEKMRLELILELSNLSKGKSTSKLRSLLEALSRYVSLNPNLFGLGLNINNMIDDFLNRGNEEHNK